MIGLSIHGVIGRRGDADGDKIMIKEVGGKENRIGICYESLVLWSWASRLKK